MSLGTILFDEIICKITRIDIEDGRLWFYATSHERRTGRVDTYADVSIFADDGTLIVHVPSIADGKQVERMRDGYLHVVLPLDISHIVSRKNSRGEEVRL